jgi:hypothetical protein
MRIRSASELLNELGIDTRQMRSTSEGEYRTTCPTCSASRKKHNQNTKVLAVKIDREGVVCHCHHCGYEEGKYYEQHEKGDGRQGDFRNAPRVAGNAGDRGRNGGGYGSLQRKVAGNWHL